jgi:hypothetical protein
MFFFFFWCGLAMVHKVNCLIVSLTDWKIIDYIKKRYNNKPMFVIENGDYFKFFMLIFTITS